MVLDSIRVEKHDSTIVLLATVKKIQFPIDQFRIYERKVSGVQLVIKHPETKEVPA